MQDVAAGKDQVRRRPLARRLLHHAGDREYLALRRADADDAILIDTLARHFLDGDDVGPLADFARRVDHLGEARLCFDGVAKREQLARRVDHLRQTAAFVLDEHVRQQ